MQRPNISVTIPRAGSNSALNSPNHGASILEVFDGDFKFLVEVPVSAVVHRPPPHLNITRLVLCRNFADSDPSSCSMADNCKFVHVAGDVALLPKHPIHVKYSWQRPDLCTYARLRPGQTVRVIAPSARAIVETVRSELVLVTAGSQRALEAGQHVALCTHYHFKRMCNRGERCNFIHLVHVDSSVAGEFQRAPPGLFFSGESVPATTHATIVQDEPRLRCGGGGGAITPPTSDSSSSTDVGGSRPHPHSTLTKGGVKGIAGASSSVFTLESLGGASTSALPHRNTFSGGATTAVMMPHMSCTPPHSNVSLSNSVNGRNGTSVSPSLLFETVAAMSVSSNASLLLQQPQQSLSSSTRHFYHNPYTTKENTNNRRWL